MSKKGGIGGHESPVSQTHVWLTPRWLFDALGPFDLDPCACSEPRPWPTASTHYTVEDDGLSRPWFGRVWCNPPYGPPPVVGPWMRRMAQHQNGIALIFARTETALFFETGWRAATAMLFLEGRVRFCRPDGTIGKTDEGRSANSGAPSVLIAYGENNARALATSKLRGHCVPLRECFPSLGSLIA